MKKIIFLLLCSLAGIVAVRAQIETPQPSPLCTISQKVGLTDVKVEYSRPSAKSRKVFGELVPFGEMWRTGANASTKITFSDKVTINEVNLDKGTYAIYTIPNETEWTIIFHKNTTYWGVDDKYNPTEDAIRVNVRSERITPAIESFTMDINNIRNADADLVLMWENTRVAVPIHFDTDNKVMSSIKSILAGPTPGQYYQSARYYYEENKDDKQALAWVTKSLENGNEKFWIVRLKSLIEARLGDYKSTIATATRSKELATKENNKDYVKMNEDSIKEWMLKLK